MGLLRNVAKTVNKVVESTSIEVGFAPGSYFDVIFKDLAQVLRDTRHIVDDVLRVLTEPSFSGDLSMTLTGLYYDNLGQFSDFLDDDIDQLVENVVDLVESVLPNIQPVYNVEKGVLLPVTNSVEALELGEQIVDIVRAAGLDGQPFDRPGVGDGVLFLANGVVNLLEGDAQLTGPELYIGVGLTFIGLGNTIAESLESLPG